MIVSTQTPPAPISIRKASATTPATFALAVLESPPSVSSVYLTADDIRAILPVLAEILKDHDEAVFQEEMMAEAQRQQALDDAEFGTAEDNYDGSPV